MENYLQRAWGDAINDISINEVKNVIAELQEMDDEHGAFWVSIIQEEETILEVDKSMKLVAVFDGDDENALGKQLNSWEEVLFFYELLLNEEFVNLRSMMQR